jgi:Cytochrome P460
MKKIPFPAMMVVAVSLAAFGGIALAAQDRFTLKVPNGLAFSEFKGYDTWQDVAVSQTETGLKVIAANPAMLNAYKKGVPGNGQHFPDGSKIVKIEWTSKKNAESPYFVMVPDTLKSVSVIEKDSKRFPNTSGWAYAQFAYDAASDTFSPVGTGAACGYACHTTVAAKDYIFTAYPKR